MKTNRLYNTLFSTTALIVLLFLLFSLSSFAITDTTKSIDQHYALNDPRNPDCPCHKFQKQAEDEFAQQTNDKDHSDNVGNNHVNTINGIEKNKPNFVVEKRGKSIKTHPVSFTKNKRKKKIIGITKIKFKFLKRNNRIKKTIPDYEICFKW